MAQTQTNKINNIAHHLRLLTDESLTAHTKRIVELDTVLYTRRTSIKYVVPIRIIQSDY